MTRDAAEADRRHEVRRTARRWREAGAIDAQALAAIEAEYPDDRHRLGPALRGLVGIFAFVAVNAFLGIVMFATNGRGGEVVLLVLGLALCAATEIQVGPLKRTQAGVEAATALLGVAYILLAVAMFEAGATTFLLVATAVCGLAAVRWGYSLAAAAAVVSFFALLGRAPGGRLLWILAGIALVPLFLKAGDSPKLPPALRECARVAAAISLVAAYLAFHLGSWDHGLVEAIGGLPPAPRDGRRILFILGTALVPLAVLALGLWSRRSFLLRVGILLALASAVTVRFYVQVAPLWVVLIAGGAASVALGLLLRRFLHTGEDRERGGYTAEPLFEKTPSRGATELAAALASFSPAPRTVPEAPLEPGGGRYGGGGASGSY